jgi:hypothetical protein
MATNTGELREILIDCIEKVKAGKMTGNDAKAVAMLAGQITLSLQVEVNARREEVALTKGGVGTLALGDESSRNVKADPAEEVEDATPSGGARLAAAWPGAVTTHRLDG